MENTTTTRTQEEAMKITLPTLTELSRSQQGIDLAGEDGDAYGPAIEEAETAISDLRRYIADAQELKSHIHSWSNESGFCDTCGADGNA